jgi:hypothetical protein
VVPVELGGFVAVVVSATELRIVVDYLLEDYFADTVSLAAIDFDMLELQADWFELAGLVADFVAALVGPDSIDLAALAVVERFGPDYFGVVLVVLVATENFVLAATAMVEIDFADFVEVVLDFFVSEAAAEPAAVADLTAVMAELTGIVVLAD